MNNKGFAATGILYTILVLFILIMLGILSVLYNRNSLLSKIQDEIKGNITTLYASYDNGAVIYYNPVSGSLCLEEDAVSTAGTKTGCMKWYIFNDNPASPTLNLILDHNTTKGVEWNNTGSNEQMTTVADQLATDTEDWNASVKSTVRLITANEVAMISGHTTFDQATSTYKYFYFGSNNSSDKTQIGSYAWLYDGANGYWTANKVVDETHNYVWVVSKNGGLFGNVPTSTSYGVRPVITLPKRILTSKQYTVTNIIANGSFEDDFTNWNSNLFSKDGGSLSTDYVYDGTQSVKIEAIGDSNEKAIGYSPTITTQAGHKYYFAMRYYLDEFTLVNSNTFTIASFIRSTDYLSTMKLDATSDVMDSWELLSTIVTADSVTYADASYKRFGQVYNSNSKYTLYMDSIVLVDLTEKFGAGNEPDQEWCDDNLTWFEGDKTVFKLD